MKISIDTDVHELQAATEDITLLGGYLYGLKIDGKITEDQYTHFKHRLKSSEDIINRLFTVVTTLP